MINIKDNLDKRICDCEVNATNEQTYMEFINNANEILFMKPLSEDEKSKLRSFDNEKLNEIVEELNWLLIK